MIGRILMLAAMALAACKPGASSEDNMAMANAAAEKAGNQCVPPALAAADGDSVGSALRDDIKKSFETAYRNACAKHVLKDRTLMDAKAADQKHLFLVNASEANAASIYMSEVDGNRMVLEYPFLTGDGVTHVPSPEELEEAIYCAVVGATPEEQESSGRCLVD